VSGGGEEVEVEVEVVSICRTSTRRGGDFVAAVTGSGAVELFDPQTGQRLTTLLRMPGLTHVA
jgi:hypothetical protein